MATTFAPPLQTLPQESLQSAYDLSDDDILMDDEDEVPADATSVPPVAAAGGKATNGDEMEIESAGTDEQIVPEKVHLRGVDNMNTGNVKAFTAEHYKEVEVVKVEWIDDTSCNLIYPTPEIALRALNSFQLEPVDLPLLTLRSTKPAPSHPNSHLQVRLAKPTDRKEKGARERSRYYLFHPEDDIVEQRERLRRERPRSDRHRYNHSEHYNDESGAGYERRYYDSCEQSRRRERNVYTEDFYSEVPRGRSRRSESNNSRDWDRERSYSPDRERRRRDRPIELFPEKCANRGRDREPKELFPSRVEPSRFRSDRSTSPEKLSARNDRQRSPIRKPVELFPEKAERKARSLEERISLPGRTLEERINLGEKDDGMGVRIKGRGAAKKVEVEAGDDLFAEKLRAAKGVGLLSDESAGRKRRGRRNKAEDLFT